jgi:serine/threonine protein kinase
VYRGEFGGEILAVKKMSRDVTKEVNILKRINHFNLIKLEGVCENRGCFYLVLEYMENGSLREWLSCKKFEETGNWAQRIQIALDVANGLYYLHSFTEPAYVHKDIKSSNVLLNGNLRAKIANFSLARAATSAAMTKHVVGSIGYMAPEYVREGQVTPKIDVYAFGVILLELITGKDAVFTQDGREALLSTEIFSIMENKNPEVELDFFVDPALKGSCGTNFALCLAKVSVACLMKEPARRPSMEEVVSVLLKIQANVQKS